MKRDNKIHVTTAVTAGELMIAAIRAKAGKTHYKSVEKFWDDRVELLNMLLIVLLSGEFRTSKYVYKMVNDSGKERLISKLPFYPDRIVHWLVMTLMVDLFLNDFSPFSHAAIKGRGLHTAFKQVRGYMLHDPEGTKWCYKGDVKHYFENVNNTVLKQQIRDMTKDDDLYNLNAEIIDSHAGLPIGNYTSQPYANKYLSSFDHWIIDLNGVTHYTRYMDDFVIFGKSREDLVKVQREVEWYMLRNLYVEIKGNWQIFRTDDRGVDFCGYRIWRNRVLLRKTSYQRLRRMSFDLQEKLRVNGFLSMRDMSKIMSRLGWVVPLTPKVRYAIYDLHFKPLINGTGTKLSKKLTMAFIIR